MDLFVVVPVLIGAGAAYVVYVHLTAHDNWKSYPTLEQYLGKHPDCKTAKGIKCSKCGSGSIKNWGLGGSNDSRRLFVCNHCGENLYRNT